MPEAMLLLFITEDETEDRREISALGNWPLVITVPDFIYVPVRAGDTNTAPVPIFESPVPDDNP